jgi:hypothetical protein
MRGFLIYMTENEIINAVYYLVEVDSEPWGTADDEYLTARGLCNIAIDRWEKYENTTWNELFAKYSDYESNNVTTDSYSYNCPDDFVRPCSFVRVNGELYDVKKPQEIASLKESSERWVYFMGNPNDGYTLNFNPNLTMIPDQTLDFEYYKSATKFVASTDVTEIPDPYFIVYFVAAHMGDEGINTDYFQMAEARLEQMAVVNMSGLYGISSNINNSLDSNDGFGN